ncbi:MAG: LPS-assembly protein LptD [Gemmatimonadetes bacterium]|nr:LPS-assembly protein LptD [Gemmatimonadota bacterium]
MRERIFQKLERLGQTRLGVDSAAVDSTAADTVTAAAEPGQPAVAGAGAADSVMTVLLSLPGYQVTTYEGAGANFDMRTQVLRLDATKDAQAQLQREGERLTADSMVLYYDDRDLVEVLGNPLYTPRAGDPVQARVMYYNLRQERGSALDATTKFQQQGEWFVRGDLPSIQPGVVFGSHAMFTTCDLTVPHSHFWAREIKMVGDGVMVARPVVLYFADVPVAWLPFMVQSLKRGRRSGLLTPVFSMNDIVRTSRGYDRRLSNLGFYWAMNDYMDSQFAFDWFSNRFVALTGGLQYNWARQFLQGSANYRQYWESGGGRQLALDTQHGWQLSERTDLRMMARYASSADFVRQNSYDPREVTQSIDSEGGLSHRFAWGNLAVNGNRRQFLSDDRVEMDFPSLSLSLSPITLFRAPQSQAAWYNNVTWSGSANASQSLRDYAETPDPTRRRAPIPDSRSRSSNLSSGFTIGRLGWSQGVQYSETVRLDVPDTATDRRLDIGEATIGWSTGLNFQQRLIGTTTFTPRLSINGSALRSDQKPEALSFVNGPVRTAFGAELKSDIYGFFPGFANYSRIRHKVATSVAYDYTPAVRQTELQDRVFGARESQARNVVTVGLNQTFEAKVEEDTTAAGADTTQAQAQAARPDTTEGPRRLPQARIVNLLSLQTTAVTYDFVRARETGDWRDGFTTTTIANQITSDFLRGLSLSIEHELFRDEGSGEARTRRFAPRLARLNTGFSLSSTSGIFRWLGLSRAAEEPAPSAQAEGAQPQQTQTQTRIDPNSIIPGTTPASPQQQPEGGERSRGWNANFSYSLQRPADPAASASQMLTINMGFSPTQNWEVRWNTSYDVGLSNFNDHILTLTRDLHEWQAHFDFRQTATGNWSFQFRVELRDNTDLKFEYDQRSPLETSVRR